MRSHRLIRRSALAVVIFVVTMMRLTGTASAHAQLEGSDPHANEVVSTAPQRVTLTFGERVEVARDAIEVFDDHLKRVDLAEVSAVPGDGNQIRVALRPRLGDGTYTVSWHVSSSDTHPVSGTFRFSVGAPSQVTGKVAIPGRNDTAGLMLGIFRVLGYGGLILGPGALLITLALWPAGLAMRRTRRTLFTGLALLGVSAFGSLFLEGVWASGLPLRAIWVSPGSLDTHSRRFGTLYAFRSYLLVLFAALLVAVVSAKTKAARQAGAPAKGTAIRRRSPVTPRPLVPNWAIVAATAISTLLLIGTWTLAGHPAAGFQTPIAMFADLLHISAMTIWLGGLAVLTISLRPAERAADLAAVLPRFSKIAFSCVVVLVATGSYQTWREVGSVDALFRTTFGRVLLVKLVAVITVVGLGALARRWVQQHLVRPAPPAHPPVAATSAALSKPRPPSGRRGSGVTTLVREAPVVVEAEPLPARGLQRGLLAEVGVALVVLSMTAALVVSVPARESYIRPFARTLTATGLQVSVRVDAPRIGDTVMHLSARTPAGKAIPLTGLRGSASLPSAKLGPLPLRLANAAGSASSGSQDVGITFPRAGKWVLALTVQTSAFDASVFSVPISVR